MTYTLDDQRDHLGEPPWSGDAVKRWEEAHGHDCRMPCYPEHGCLVIEAERERLVARVTDLEAGLERIALLGADVTGTVNASCHWHHKAADIARALLDTEEDDRD
jgi:hypothetical protein